MAWTAAERRTLDRLSTPAKVQEFLDRLGYDPRDGARSPRVVLRERKAHCFGGALLAIAALRRKGYRARLVHLDAVDDDAHVICVYRERSKWGAIAKSNFTTLRSREPIYLTLRELIMSYFDFYFNTKGQKTLRRYSAPLDLSRFDGLEWEFDTDELVYLDQALSDVRHYPLLSASEIRKLGLASRQLVRSSTMFSNKKGLFKP